MSCEGNRQRFFSLVEQRLPGVKAATLERIYQTAKNAPETEDEAVVDKKTRLLFRDMAEVGIHPPTHSPDGLPKKASRKGYAAVLDYLRGCKVETFSEEERIQSMPEYSQSTGFNLAALDGENKNVAGFIEHAESAPGMDVRFGDGEGFRNLFYGSLQNPMLYPDDPVEAVRFMQSLDEAGFLPDGYDWTGFNPQGLDRQGRNRYGLSAAELQDEETLKQIATRRFNQQVYRPGRKSARYVEVDVEGFSPVDGFRPLDGAEEQDVDRLGYTRSGFRKGRTFTGYDENGLDLHGQPAPRRKGYDRFGYEKTSGLTAPDEQGRRYNLIGWVYDPDSDTCYNPADPTQRMVHSGSFTYSTKLQKVVLKRSYVPGREELIARLKDPGIRMREVQAGGPPLWHYFARRFDATYATCIFQASPLYRYLTSEERANRHPEAHFAGIRLRCPKCGQFTGAAPHSCPQYGGQRVLALQNGVVIGLYPREEGVNLTGSLPDHLYTGILRFIRGKVFQEYSSPQVSLEDSGVDISGGRYFSAFQSNFHDLNTLSGGMWQRFLKEVGAVVSGERMTFRHLFEWDEEKEAAVVLETPFTPLKEYEADYHGGDVVGFHRVSGLTEDGYDLLGFHYLSGRHKVGEITREGLKLRARFARQQEELLKDMSRYGVNNLRELLQRTYSRIATGLAGAPRRVQITEEGGPRAGMFWTDMQGTIQAEMFPVLRTRHNSPANNLLAFKAGLYHELGHEEDTPVGIFRQVVAIAQGEEEVPGIPREQAGLVAEVYNILEDGRMEREQAKRRRGVAVILAADAQTNPRWDEQVGEGIPATHQVMGMMLYRSLPFFRVRQEVVEAAPPRVRKLFDEVLPYVDRAMGSPEEAFACSIAITRKLLEDEEFRRLAERMTQEKSQGGQWVEPNGEGQGLILSALPRPGRGRPSKGEKLPLPPQNWQPDDPLPGENGEAQATGTNEGDPRGEGRHPGTAEEAEQNLKPETSAEGSASGGGGRVGSEVDEEFFSGLSTSPSVMENALMDVLTDLRHGVRLSAEPFGKQMLKPSSREMEIVLPADEQRTNDTVVRHITTHTSGSASTNIRRIREEARKEGLRLAKRLSVLKQEVSRKVRFQTEGTPDRRRYKRAVVGSDTVYRRERLVDVTSLAVGLQVDVSGSMYHEVGSGHLAGVTAAIEEALRNLNAEFFVTAFGSETAIVKTLGDARIPDESLAALTEVNLGGTVPDEGLRLSLHTFRETQSANKLHFMLTDGDFSYEEARGITRQMRQSGILPFGLFLGQALSPEVRQTFDLVFGEGNWVHIRRLSDMADVVGERIERIYRRILATR